MSETAEKRSRPRRRGWLFVGLGVLLAGGLVGYGIWSRSTTTSQLTKTSADAAIPQVQMITPKHGPAQRTLTLPGNIEAWYQASIYGQVAGYVSHWYKDYGAEVKGGDVLATIEAPSVDAELAAAKAQLVTVQARYNLAVVTAKRWVALSGTQAVAQEDVDIKKADAAAQQAEVAAAQQNVARFEAMSAFENVVAPFDGVVTARNLNIGDYVVAASGGSQSARGPTQSLFIVADIHKLRVFVSVPQAFSDALRPGLTATITLPQNPGKSIPVQFLTNARAVTADTRTVVTEFVLDNPSDELWPGAYASVHFSFPGEPDLLIVPEQAVLFRTQGTQVALIGDDGKVHLQDVTLGRNLGTDVEIVTGLKPTDKLVASPSAALLDSQPVKIVQPAPGATPSGSSLASPSNQPQPNQPAPSASSGSSPGK
jgi:membrane fusion protein (multidrug efflux system)